MQPSPQTGECVQSQSFCTSSVRVCQPTAAALKADITSGNMRRVVACL